MAPDFPTLHESGRISLFSLPLEIRNLIYKNLLLSPIPLPPIPPQSEQYVYTAILRTNRCIYDEAIDFLYQRNFFAIHLRSNLNKSAYDPLLSNLTAQNAAKIRGLEIVLWGNYDENDGDTVSFGTENFGIALENLIYAPKLVVCIDIEMQDEAQDVGPGHGSMDFCAFDWLMATFSDEWFYNKTYFDLFRAVARFHMNRMFPDSHLQMCESQWFSESRATPGLKQHEQMRLWDLEERYGLTHEEGEDKPDDSENGDRGTQGDDDDMGSDEDDKGMESDGNDESEDEEDQKAESSDESGVDAVNAASNSGHGKSSG